ncbi:MAG: hypothetical protein R2717_00625 [Schumannella sp.]
MSDRTITVVGDAAVVAYTMQIDYDFGDEAQFHKGGRGTEVWLLRTDGDFGSPTSTARSTSPASWAGSESSRARWLRVHRTRRPHRRPDGTARPL